MQEQLSANLHFRSLQYPTSVSDRSAISGTLLLILSDYRILAISGLAIHAHDRFMYPFVECFVEPISNTSGQTEIL